jgi:hypothetical protein
MTERGGASKSQHYYPELQSSIVRMVERVILNNAAAEPALNQAAEEYVAASK